jgi:hypothetical protein
VSCRQFCKCAQISGAMCRCSILHKCCTLLLEQSFLKNE